MAKPKQAASRDKTGQGISAHTLTKPVPRKLSLGTSVICDAHTTALGSAKFSGMERIWWVNMGSSPGEGAQYHPTTFDAGDIEAAAPEVKVIILSTQADPVEASFLHEFAELVAQGPANPPAVAGDEIDVSSLLEP